MRTSFSSFTLSVLGSVALAESSMFVSDAPQREPLKTNLSQNGFGHTVFEQVFAENHTEKHIMQPELPYFLDYDTQASVMQNAADWHANYMTGNDQSFCDGRDPEGSDTTAGAFLPVFDGYLSDVDPKLELEGRCFEHLNMKFTRTAEMEFTVDITRWGKKSLLCTEAILLANTEVQHFELLELPGHTKLTFEIKSQQEYEDVYWGGIKAFGFCDGVKDSIESIWNFAKGFVGGLSDHPYIPYVGTHVPKYMEDANVDFLGQAMGYHLEPRETKKVEIDPDLIQSGDFFSIMRLDGLDPIIMYGTGSHVGHSVMALRFDGELYICESQDGWYWPTHGIQRTKWADWIKQAEQASFHVAWNPLNAETRAIFDEKAAQEWFFKTEGLPYGYHNFLYGWIDTPDNNWPPFLANEFVPIMFAIVQDFAPKVAYNFFSEALNFRLGTTGLDIQHIAQVASERDMGIEDVMAMVEQDGWEYTGEEPRDGLSYVCSSYVISLYKAAGIFGDFADQINATEFGPRDVTALKIFDKDIVLPEQCVAADPTLPYCQLLGNYRMTIPDYSTVEPYPHMNEACKINWPEYSRDDGC